MSVPSAAGSSFRAKFFRVVSNNGILNTCSQDPYIVEFHFFCISHSDVPEILTKIFNLLLTYAEEGGRSTSFVSTSRFVVLTLRGLLVSQLSATNAPRKRLLERLLDIILSTNAPHAEQNLQRTCLLRSLHLLLPLHEAAYVNTGLESEIEPEPLSLNEEVTHCLVNPLAVQKCFCLVGLRLRTAWQLLRKVADSSPEQASLEGAPSYRTALLAYTFLSLPQGLRSY